MSCGRGHVGDVICENDAGRTTVDVYRKVAEVINGCLLETRAW